jgi:hypothetical protein
MPNADQSRVLTRVTTLLNLAAPGTFSSTISSRNKTRHADEIAAFVTEAGLEILQMLAETPNEYRNNFVAETTPSHGDFLEDHQGQPAYVSIQKYSGGPFEPGSDAKTYLEIESMRNNPNIYDPAGKAHNVSGSSLAGYYNIWERKFYFTGFAAKVGLAQVTRTDVATKIPELLEPVWVKKSVGKALKSGLAAYDAEVVKTYGGEAENDMAEFKQGRRIFSEASDPESKAEVHAR